MITEIQADQLKYTNAAWFLPHKAGWLILCLLAVWLIAPGYTSAQNIASGGAIEGTAFVVGPDGASYVPGAKVALQGPKMLDAETDENGRYELRDVEPGRYSITATFPSLQATQEVTVLAGTVVKAELAKADNRDHIGDGNRERRGK